MAFTVSPTSVAPSGSLTASGTGAKKRPTRIRIGTSDPVMPNAILAEFNMPASGKFSRLINAPGGSSRTTTLVLQQLRTDNVWAQTADVKLLVVAGGSGGGTTPEPPNTPPTPPDIAPTGINHSVTTTSATVSWTTTDPSTGIVRYWTNPAVKTSTASTASGTSGQRTLPGLTPGQTYGYEVVTTSGSTTIVSSSRSFTTTAAATLPGAPTGLVATGGNAQVVLTWSAPASNGGSAITGYRIFRNGVSLTTDPASPYTDSTVSNGTSYTYTVAAITGVGEGPQSASASATPAAAGDINPPVISNVVVSNVTTSGFTVSWNTNEAATGLVEYGTGTGYGNQTGATSSGTNHSRTISGLVSQTTYHFRVRATDTAGNLRIDSDRTVTTSFIPSGSPVNVSSLSALKAALKVNSNTEIVLAAGTYAAAPANNNQTNSLWIATPEMAARTNPVTVHAGGSGVILDGGGAKYFGAITFDRGVHHQTWDGSWTLANGEATATGTIVFGSPNAQNIAAGVHHINLTGDWVFDDSLTGYAYDPARSNANDHAIYFTDSLGGCHDILLDGMSLTPNPSAPLHSWLHLFTHGYPGGAGAYNVTAKNADITGTRQVVMIFDSSLHDLLLQDVSIHDALRFGVRYEMGSNVTLRRVQTDNSAVQGYYSPGPVPTFDGCHYDTGTKELVIP